MYGSFSFVGSEAPRTECALLSRSTWGHSGPLVSIDDSYQKARPLSLCAPLLHACIHSHSLLITHPL